MLSPAKMASTVIHPFFTKFAGRTMEVLKTEDLGKTLEMAVCLAFRIPYVGKFKYDMAKAERLALRLVELPTKFPVCTHTAEKGARYDFTSVSEPLCHLSAKTSKHKSAKVAPQVIGQCQPAKFCSIVGTEFVDVPKLKEFIQTNITNILPVLVDHTFDCKNLYYNETTGKMLFVEMHTKVDWSSYTYTWTRPCDTWTNSSTLKIHTPKGEHGLVEFQFHTKSRTNMAVRWCYDVFLDLFRDNLTIHDL